MTAKDSHIIVNNSHNKYIVEKLTNMVTGTQLTTTNEQRKYTG